MKEKTKKCIIEFVKKILNYKEPISNNLTNSLNIPVTETSVQIKKIYAGFILHADQCDERLIKSKFSRMISDALINENILEYTKTPSTSLNPNEQDSFEFRTQLKYIK